jgi:hypothetical protein
MSEDVKDAGLVAMIGSILGGNKRADTVEPPLPAEFVQPAQTGKPAPAKPIEPVNHSLTPDGKRRLPAEAIADIVLGELRKIEDFPASGASVTVYGYRHWNAMITFAPFSTNFRNATRFRQAMPDLVFKLRRLVELEI